MPIIFPLFFSFLCFFFFILYDEEEFTLRSVYTHLHAKHNIPQAVMHFSHTCFLTEPTYNHVLYPVTFLFTITSSLKQQPSLGSWPFTEYLHPKQIYHQSFTVFSPVLLCLYRHFFLVSPSEIPPLSFCKVKNSVFALPHLLGRYNVLSNLTVLEVIVSLFCLCLRVAGGYTLEVNSLPLLPRTGSCHSS